MLTAYVVDTLSDSVDVDGFISLREALVAASSNGDFGDAPAGTNGPDSITFDPALAGTITLNGTTLSIGDGTILTGPGADVITISGNNASRVFFVDGGATIKGLGITGGGGDELGGAILVDGFASQLFLNNCWVHGNHATISGGGLHVFRGTVRISDSTFSENTSDFYGGALTNDSGTLYVTNSTVSGNSTPGTGGGIENFSDGFGSGTFITNSTVTGNGADSDSDSEDAGGGIHVSSGALELNNTIVAGNFVDSATNANDIDGTVTGSFSLIGDASSSGGLTNGTDGNIVGVNGAGVLNINTVLNTSLSNDVVPVHSLASNSLAVDAGSNIFAVDPFNVILQFDQRGTPFARVVNGTVDIGSVEADAVVQTRPLDIIGYDAGTGRWRLGTNTGTSITWTNGPKWNPASGWKTFTGDYNGDGLVDGIGITSSNAVFFARNNGDGTMTNVSAGSFSTAESFQHVMVGDFNGDGRTDLIVQQSTSNTTPLPGSWFVKSWNGTAFTTSFYGRWEAAGWIGFAVGDVNQDGVDDIIGVRNAEGVLDRVNWLYGISNRIPDGSRRFYAQFAGAFTGRVETAGWSSILVGDWDHDGRTDVAARKNDGRFVYGTATGGPTAFAAIGANRLINSTGPLFSPAAFAGPFLVGDFNGDGRDDIMTRQSNNKNLWVALSSATAPTSSTAQLWGTWDDTRNWSGAIVGDFNDDGLDDYGSADLTGSHAWVSFSTGSAFFPASDVGLITGPEALVGPLRYGTGRTIA